MLKRLQLYFKPDLKTIIDQDLIDAKIALHSYRAQAEFYTHMVKLHEEMVSRLTKTNSGGN